MAEKQDVNPLLFSANTVSPFDNIHSSAVLCPPTSGVANVQLSTTSNISDGHSTTRPSGVSYLNIQTPVTMSSSEGSSTSNIRGLTESASSLNERSSFEHSNTGLFHPTSLSTGPPPAGPPPPGPPPTGPPPLTKSLPITDGSCSVPPVASFPFGVSKYSYPSLATQTQGFSSISSTSSGPRMSAPTTPGSSLNVSPSPGPSFSAPTTPGPPLSASPSPGPSQRGVPSPFPPQSNVPSLIPTQTIASTTGGQSEDVGTLFNPPRVKLPTNVDFTLPPRGPPNFPYSPSDNKPSSNISSIGTVPTLNQQTTSGTNSMFRRSGNKYVVSPDCSTVNLQLSSTAVYQSSSVNSFSGPSIYPTASFNPTTSDVDDPSDQPNVAMMMPLTTGANNPASVADLPFGVSPDQVDPFTRSPATLGPVNANSQSTIIPTSFEVMASNPPLGNNNNNNNTMTYHPVIHHWFYASGKLNVWKPFSFTDSMNLEESFRQGSNDLVSTDGGRCDVNINGRERVPVYWSGEPAKVRRCSWFYKEPLNTTQHPYEEHVADQLEAEYRDAMVTGCWHRQIELEGNGRMIINSPLSMHHYPLTTADHFPTGMSINDSQTPLTVKRGVEDFLINDGETDQVDHLLFLVHGIGSVCDLSFRPVEECVDDFRSLGDQLIASHFSQSYEKGEIGRVEILPISWHKALHGDATGLDEKLRPITLRSIPKLREFTNDTLLDVLFYTSPVYCQLIIETVTSELERIRTLFLKRHPTFSGGISLGGHSLGSVILFDLLMHQTPTSTKTKANVVAMKENESNEPGQLSTDSMTSSINFEIGVAGTGQPSVIYPQLSFSPEAFFLLGSPVSMFITVRGIATMGCDFKLPTCDRVFNIFHPFDPVAYRLETLIDPTLTDLRPVLIPHHKGRKRLHLELKDTIERVGTDLKHKIFDSIQTTWNHITQTYFGSSSVDSSPTKTSVIDEEMDKVIEQQMCELGVEATQDQPSVNSSSIDNSAEVKVGQLNGGRRIDYVLQEKPYESFTEYIFALQAHVTYWQSEDTMLMMLKELYSIQGILSDVKLSTQVKPQYSPIGLSSLNIKDRSSIYTPSIIEAPATPVPLFPSAPSSEGALLPPNYALLDTIVSPNTISNLSGRPMVDPSKLQQPLGLDPTARPADTTPIGPPPVSRGTVPRKSPFRR